MRFADAIVPRFPELPSSVLLKAELLRHGVRFGEAPVGTRHYHHHDEKGQKKQADQRVHLQGSVMLPGGAHVFVGHNPESPYIVLSDLESGRLQLAEGEDLHPICDLEPGPRFQWTRSRTSKNTPMAAIVTPSLGGACGPLALFLLRYCEFTRDEQECRFCSWVRMGRSQEVRPDVADIRETFDAVWREQASIGYLAFSGGSLFDRTKEADAFLRYMDAVRETGAALPATVAAIQALDAADSRRLRDAGFDYVCYSMEVWDERLWPEVLPGKASSVGRAKWMECLMEAVEVFGPGKVMCNFVAGVETAVPGLFATPEAAADSTLEGMRWCCENGIYPKYAVWIVQGGARFSGRPPAPLEYYARLALGRQALYSEFAIPIPETDCAQCLTQSFEADLALLDPARHARGPAAARSWRGVHPTARVLPS